MELVFIGFGEAAYHLTCGLRRAAGAELTLSAFDAQADDAVNGGVIRQRAAENQVKLLASLDEAIASEARFVLCLTSARSALPVAQQLVPHLRAGQVYVDMNSSAPTVKQAIAALPHRPGVQICDAAVMGTVPGNQHRVPMLLAGDGAKAFHDAFSAYGMRLTVLQAEAGAASAIKMLKSVVMKGLPQLLIEAFQAAEKFGVTETLAASLAQSLEGKTVEQLANTFTARTLIHAARRSAEMQDVVATLDALGVDAGMSKATQQKLEQLAAQNWKTRLGPEGSEMPYQDAIRFLVQQNKGDVNE